MGTPCPLPLGAVLRPLEGGLFPDKGVLFGMALLQEKISLPLNGETGNRQNCAIN
jgi:hypothetical protein